MFNGITSINKNYAYIKINTAIKDDLINLNLVFEEDNRRILGQIEEISDSEIKVKFLGEFNGDKLSLGVERRPSTNANVRIINGNELAIITSYNDPYGFLLGLSPLYNNSPVKININKMWSGNTAIIGNNGSGKTYGMTSILQNLFTMPNYIAFNSIFFIFNTNYEYYNAFNNINKFNYNFNYKLYTNNKEKSNNSIKLPLYLLNSDDYVNLLRINNFTEISIIKKMLSYVSLFTSKDNNLNSYKNYFLASFIIKLITSNEDKIKIKEYLFNVLNRFYTKEINLDTNIMGVDYRKELRNCFDINSNGEFSDKVIVCEYLQNFINNSNNYDFNYRKTYFTLDDLESSLNFTLIYEGLSFKDDSFNKIKLSFNKIFKGELKEIFEYESFISINDFISSLILVGDNKRAQIINFVFEGIDTLTVKSFIKVYSRIVFNFIKSLSNVGSMPIHIILEDAHNYLNIDSDREIIGYNIFEDIIKNGRRYGIMLDLITDKPNLIVDGLLSRYNNYIIFNTNDNEVITSIIKNNGYDIIDTFDYLKKGTCLVVGEMTVIPMIVKLQIPTFLPTDNSTNIFDMWMIQWKN